MVILLLVLLMLFGVFTLELYRYLFRRKSSALLSRLFSSNGHGDDYMAFREAAAQRLSQADHETWSIRSSRGQELRGFYYPNGAGGKTIAFVAHGYRSDHTWTASICYDYYKSRGIDVFACDHTAHGESEGQVIGFDVLECKDCLAWVEFLLERFGPTTELILHGFSMGAATVLQMSGDCPPNVKFIVSDSAYACARAALAHQIGPMYQPLRWINRVVGGYDWNDSDVTASLNRASVPILFIHGREDKMVPFENGPRLYGLYQGEKDCLFPDGTGHIEAMYTIPEAYRAKLDHFIELYLEKRDGPEKGSDCRVD